MWEGYEIKETDRLNKITNSSFDCGLKPTL